MKKRFHMDRRRFLKGAGTVLVGLPFLEFSSRFAYGLPNDVPERFITFFFGLGVPNSIHAEGYANALSPLGEFAQKLSMARGIDMNSGDTSLMNHFDGSNCVFRGQRVGLPGGSIDQVVLDALYPNGVDTPIQTLMAGSFYRSGEGNTPMRYLHSYNADGSPVEVVPRQTPRELFERVFGAAPPTGSGSDDVSVLDSVLDQLNAWGNHTGVSTESKQRLNRHATFIRELENRIKVDEAMQCDEQQNPGDDDLPLIAQVTLGVGAGAPAPILEPEAWATRWRLMADIYATAIRCDMVRFGNAMFQSGGERVMLRGPYQFADGTVRNYNEQETAHEFWHAYQSSNPNTDMRWHMRFMMDQIAYFIRQLDHPDHLDANGKTIFDNCGFMLGTELGDGNKHDMKSVFHVTNSVGGRLKTGQILNLGTRDCVDLYNTVLTSLNITPRMGNQNFYQGDIAQLLV